ncbi:hypothetical protein ARMGADRAFT_1066525 [Armillaria gallica]|uniref:Protein kinase domain-containing protein n=1 Tax=Armillaria gallica TaxID=47427 RepID=A0A2H3DC19_ARMGA|nr:hypothetical protein ARMGADRAFT_1066525 [Armillaria gallica]
MPIERTGYGIAIENGHVLNAAFKVQIDDDKDMLDLMKQTASEYPVPALHAVIWLPNEFLPLGPSAPEDLRARMVNRQLRDIAKPAEVDQTVESIIDISQSGVQVRKTHIVIEIPPPAARARPILPEEETDFVGALAKKYESVVAGTNKGKSPPASAQPDSYNAHQGKSLAILDGRYNAASDQQTIAPPIELYHPVFAQFRAKLTDTEIVIPEDIVRDTASLMRSSSAIHVSEQPRTQQSHTLLSKILKQSFLHPADLYHPSADIALCGNTAVDETAAVVIVEEMSELGAGGSEPCVQGSFSYIKFWVDATHQKIREGCCCPSFIVGLAGPWLIIAGAVFTSKVIVQRPTDYLWLGNSHANDDDHILRIAHILYSLQGSIKYLQSYYKNLKPQSLEANKPHPRFFPSITSYPSNGREINFTYTSPLELDDTCMTFLATLGANLGQKKVVVKFVQRYGEVAHRLLEELQLAPALLYAGPIDGCGVSFQMIVMEYIQGQTLVEAHPDGLLPIGIKKAIKTGLDTLHSKDFVYGDLRRQNIMVTDEDNRIRFIDFDWAGKVGEVSMPPPSSLLQEIIPQRGAPDSWKIVPSVSKYTTLRSPPNSGHYLFVGPREALSNGS